MTNTQTVNVTDDPSETGTEETVAPEQTVDELLAEFEAEETPTVAPVAEKPEPVDTGLADRIAALENQDTEKALDDLTNLVKGDSPLPDNLARGFILEQASKNPKLAEAFRNRSNDPGTFSKLSKALQSDYAKLTGDIPDKNATEDHEAVVAAVQSGKTHTPADTDDIPDNVGTMTDSEYESWKQKSFGR